MPEPAAIDPVDAHFGRRLRLARNAVGCTPADLARWLDVGEAELDELERGATPLCARQLYRLALLFEVSVRYFFDGLSPDQPRGGREGPGNGLEALRSDPGLLELIGAYYGIEDDALRSALVDLACQMHRGLAAGARSRVEGPPIDRPPGDDRA